MLFTFQIEQWRHKEIIIIIQDNWFVKISLQRIEEKPLEIRSFETYNKINIFQLIGSSNKDWFFPNHYLRRKFLE
jgi:hypothetical protein